MERFTTITAIAAPILRDNIDTDAIIPSREIKGTGKTGLADGLFAGWRYTSIGGREPVADFVLNRPEYCEVRILLTGANVGCGSSREHAAWALAEYGIRAIIAPSFNPIFQGNCVRNGIVPVVLAAETVAGLAEAIADHDPRLTLDLAGQQVIAPTGVAHHFTIAEEAKAMLMEGLDAIDLTLQHHTAISAFIAADRVSRGWASLAVERRP